MSTTQTQTQTQSSKLPTSTPSGYTRAQFLRDKKSGKLGKQATWAKVYQWQSRTRAEREAARQQNRATSFGAENYQIPMSEILARANALYPVNPSYAASNNAQLAAQAKSLLGNSLQTQIQALTQDITRRSQQGSAAISGYMRQYLNTLPGLQSNIANIYSEARNLQGQAASGLAESISNSGGQIAADLKAAEQAAGQTSTGSDYLSGVGAGYSGASAANDFSTMSRLISQGAADQAYAAQLAPIGSAYGAQMLSGLQSQLNNELASGTADLRTQGAQQMQQAYQYLLDREMQKAQGRDQRGTARANFIAALMGQNNDNAITGQALSAGLQQQSAANAQSFTQNMAPQTTTQTTTDSPQNGTPTLADYAPDIQKGTAYLEKSFMPSLYKKDPVTGKPSNVIMYNGTARRYRTIFSQAMARAAPYLAGMPPALAQQAVENFLASYGIYPPQQKTQRPGVTINPPRESHNIPRSYGPNQISPGLIQRGIPSISGR